MSRKKWYVVAGALALATAVRFGSFFAAYRFDSETNAHVPRFGIGEVTSANRFLLDFPRELPGARSVEKFLTPDARYCLVHVRQMHLTSTIAEDDLPKVEACQDDIYQILRAITDRTSMRVVYKEGENSTLANLSNLLAASARSLDGVLERERNRMMERYNSDIDYDVQRLSALREGKLDVSIALDGSTRERYEAEILQRIEQNRASLAREAGRAWNPRQYRYDGLERLAHERQITIRGAETLEGNLSARNDDYSMVDRRENILLDIIGAQDDSVIIVVYGAAHAWGGFESFKTAYSLEGKLSNEDNIAAWNSAHPDKKVSLIEITPVRLPPF